MKKEIAPELLERYLHGECTDEELSRVYAWYDAFEEEDDLLSHLAANDKEELKKVLLERIKADMDIDAVNEDSQPRRLRFPKSNIFYFISIAAVLIMALGILIYIQNRSAGKTPQWVDKIIVRNTGLTYAKQILPDGSTVWLSPGSVMQYPKVFDKDKRDILMIGEAFFEVTKNPAQPFTIYSDKIATRVWGTSFKVNASENSPMSQVAVLTGKVSVSMQPSYMQSTKNFFGADDRSNEVMLLPNQQAIYSKADGSLQKTVLADKAVILPWKRENASFNNDPLKKVIGVLNKTFDVHIVAADANIEKYHIKADFSNQNLADILEVLHLSMNLDYTINNNQIQLKKIPN